MGETDFKLDEVDLEANQAFREAAVAFVVRYNQEQPRVVPRHYQQMEFNRRGNSLLLKLVREHDLEGTFCEGPARKAFEAGVRFALKLHGKNPWEQANDL